MSLTRNKKILTGLDHSSYEHPFDAKALKALEKTPGLKIAGDYINKHISERLYSIQYTGSNIKYTKSGYPKIYEYLDYACDILDIKKRPDLYSCWDYSINAFTVGSENPLIVLNSGVLDLCDDDEIMYIIGHELGHIKSNHMVYHMMARLINIVIDQIPFGNVAAAPLRYALYYWDRMSEFTADRAGLLCCQKPTSAIEALIKMSGIPHSAYERINVESFIEQAKEFKQLDYEGLNKIFKLISIADSSHPWTVMRGAHLIEWLATGEPKQIISREN